MDRPFPRDLPWATLGRRESTDELLQQWKLFRAQLERREDLPLFRFWVEGGGDAKALRETLESLVCQSYPHWEAVGEGTHWEEMTAECGDSRLRTEPQGRSAWECRIRPGTRLSPVALSLFHLEASRNPKATVLYCNHVLLGRDPVFVGKPEPSAFTLLHLNYVGESFFWKSGQGPAAGLSGSTLHRWILERDLDSLHLCPYYLFYFTEGAHSRMWGGALEWKAIEGAVEKRIPSARIEVEEGDCFPLLRVCPPVPKGRVVSVILPFRGKVEWTVDCVRSLSTDRSQLEVELLLVNNDSTPEELNELERGLAGIEYRLISYPGSFDYGRMNNEVIRNYARGDLLFFLNNDVVVSNPLCLDQMAAWAVQPQTGTVGMLLRYPNGDIQYDGIRADFGGEARLARVGHFARSTPFSRLSREVFANTFAACMVRRDVFEACGGLREWEMNNGFGDVAFNLECRRRGLHNLFLGHLEGSHRESGSRGRSYEYWEEFFLERDYCGELQRMLRADLSWNRVPQRSSPLQALEALARRGLREWLGPAAPALKKGLRGLLSRGDNRVQA